jgi:hypothetical protein
MQRGRHIIDQFPRWIVPLINVHERTLLSIRTEPHTVRISGAFSVAGTAYSRACKCSLPEDDVSDKLRMKSCRLNSLSYLRTSAGYGENYQTHNNMYDPSINNKALAEL